MKGIVEFNFFRSNIVHLSALALVDVLHVSLQTAFIILHSSIIILYSKISNIE